MPALHLFRRRTLLGGDDLQPACFMTCCVRAVQFFGLLLPIWAHIVVESRRREGLYDFLFYDPSSAAACRHSHLFAVWLVTYAACSTLYCAASLYLEYWMQYWSSQGAPTVEMEPRTAQVQQLLETKLVPGSIVQFLMALAGMAALSLLPLYRRCCQEEQEAAAELAFADSIMTASDSYQLEADSLLTEPFRILLQDNNATTTESDQSVFRLSESQAPTFFFLWHYWWIALVLLLLAQLAEVGMAWTFLWSLYQQPEEVTDIVTTRQDGRNTYYASTSPSAASFAAQRHRHHHHELVEEMWADRCTAFCQCLSSATCFVFGGRELVAAATRAAGTSGNPAFGDVARALADYLEGTSGVLDVVPSDIVTGFLVLQRLQRQRRRRTRHFVLQDSLAQTNSLEEGTASSHTATATARPVSSPDLLSMTTTMSPPTDNQPNNDKDHPTTQEQEQQQRDEQRRTSLILNPLEFHDRTVLEEGARYAKFALAIYTWVLYLYVHPLTGVPRLLARRSSSCTDSCCCCIGRRRRRRRRHGHSRLVSASLSAPTDGVLRDSDHDDYDFEDGQYQGEGDNLCETHKSALLLTAGLDDSDLVYVQLKSSFSDTPYCILLDHRWKSVVLSVRGTFSLEDCVTDVLIDPESLEKLGQDFGFDATNQHCHGGVLACVHSVHRDLERHGWLDRLLVGDNAHYPDYTLRLTGHSLGAATCTLLSYMLRPKFPTLRCINYSPPGCSLTWEMATGCKEWCTSFVLDSDLVPRLSFDSMEQLRNEILDLIGRIKVNKIEVAARVVHGSGLWGCRICSDVLEEQELLLPNIEDILYDDNELPDSNYRRQLERFKAIQEDRRQARGAIRSIKLYPPGKMVHLVKTGERRSCWHGLAKCLTCCATNAGFQYTPKWVDNDELNEIVVSPTMGTDHFPNRIAFMLERVASDFGLQPGRGPS